MPFFQRAGLQLHYVEEGQGPPVLLIHGWGGRARRQWHNTMLQLREKFHFYALELRGHGHSEEVHDPEYTWIDLAEDCDALREIAGCERWVVVGYSFGALVALNYARFFPQHTLAVCAVSPMMVGSTASFLMRYFRWPVVWLLRSARRLPPILANKMIHNIAKTRLRTLFHTVEMMKRWQPKNARIDPSVPVVIMMGELDRHAHSERVIAAAGRADVRMLEDTGHFPLWKQRQRFISELSDVLEKYAAKEPVASP